MLSFLTIDLAALGPWAGKIDANDAAIVAYIRQLGDPEKPPTAARMWKALPLLHLPEGKILDRLQHLQEIGILVDGYALSPAYYDAEGAR